MRVVISVGGKFCAFHLAAEMHRRGYLEKIITSYPRFAVDGGSLPSRKIICLPLPELLARALELTAATRNLPGNRWKTVWFDHWAAGNIGQTDLFVCWASFGLASIPVAREAGAQTIIDRGNVHIVTQEEILSEEYDRFAYKKKPVDPVIKERMLAEYDSTDYIVVPSEYVRRSFLSHGVDAAKLFAVPLGADIHLFRPHQKKDDVFRVVFVGGITLRKGIQYLLQAASELNLPKFEVVLAGRPEPEFLPVLTKYQVHFEYAGRIPQTTLPEFYSQGSVFVLPSVEDGFGMVVVEAMACGLPVLCTTHTGAADIVRDGVDGFVVPARNVEILKEKIIYLYEHEDERKEMGLRARQRARDFTWGKYGDRMEGVYRKIIE